jgi:tRNA G18 (ribose-2'-O)-methylase SpoU
MGATLSLPLLGFEEMSALDALRSDGWILVAAALEGQSRGPESLSKVDKLALVLGNERFGIPSEVRERCVFSVGIPQKRKADEGLDSLNVAAAAAILLWEGSP